MIAIIDSVGANIASLVFALQRLGATPVLTDDLQIIQKASHVILPGVGSASFAMQRLNENGLVEMIQSLTQPVLGICLGMQLLYEYSDEGAAKCLGIVSGRIKKLKSSEGITVPHMGWNMLTTIKNSSLLSGIDGQSHVYFVHSYAASVASETSAISRHGQDFSAVIQYRNFYGTQFHPERSGKCGEAILRNFLEVSK